MKRRGCWIGLGVFVVLIVGLLFTGPGAALRDIWSTGVIQNALTPEEQKAYQGDTAKNLKAIYTALMLYHDSEGQFPKASGWMDAIEPRLSTSDLKKGEAEKKLIRPDLLGKADAYGYAMNDQAGGKYKDDIKNAKSPLVYESKQTVRNAHGDPKTDGAGSYVAVDGSIGQIAKP